MQANDLYLDSETEQQQLLQQMIGRQATRIDRIIQDTLNMVKNKETHPVPIHLNEFIPLFIQEDLADIRDQIQFNIDIPLMIQFDEAQFRQILINLIRNAIRHNAADAAYIQLNVHPYEHRVWIDIRILARAWLYMTRPYCLNPF